MPSGRESESAASVAERPYPSWIPFYSKPVSEPLVQHLLHSSVSWRFGSDRYWRSLQPADLGPAARAGSCRNALQPRRATSFQADASICPEYRKWLSSNEQRHPVPDRSVLQYGDRQDLPDSREVNVSVPRRYLQSAQLHHPYRHY